MASLLFYYFTRTTLAATIITIGSLAGGANGAVLFDTMTNGGFTTSSTGTSQFVYSSGWAISNTVENSVIASITSPFIVVTDSSMTINITHSYSFEYELDSAVPDLNGDSFDKANVEISVNGGTFTLFDNWDSNGYTPDTDGVDGLNQQSGWSHVSNSVVSSGTITGLTNGDNLRIRLNAGWDDSFFEEAPNWTITELGCVNK